MKASYGGRTFQFKEFDELWRFYRHILNSCPHHLVKNKVLEVEKPLKS